jgi:predicted RNA-binding Zn-ribbon protein involved in translation (DUF1610 family)
MLRSKGFEIGRLDEAQPATCARPGIPIEGKGPLPFLCPRCGKPFLGSKHAAIGDGEEWTGFCGEEAKDEQIRQFDEFRATFRPRRTDDLKPNAEAHVGARYLWCASWIIEEGPYTGQWACTPMEVISPPFGWVPLCDLAEIEEAKP